MNLFQAPLPDSYSIISPRAGSCRYLTIIVGSENTIIECEDKYVSARRMEYADVYRSRRSTRGDCNGGR